jgi:8-oxo-dGTP pyrophosphatase MutT (NUDIX family)
MPRNDSTDQTPSLFASQLIPHLHRLLIDLVSFPYPTTESPPGVPRRASVALIIRIQPHSKHYPPKEWGSTQDSTLAATERLDTFFSQDWVKYGDPEILFIKRAQNKLDKWSGNIAFPGGRRDPDDADDCAAAIRETWEEVGIDLSSGAGNAIPAGNFEQIVITTQWGTKSSVLRGYNMFAVMLTSRRLLTFCPFIFLLTKSIPPMRLQSSEVASAHWVPVRALMNPKYFTYWTQDVAARGSREPGIIARLIAQMLTGPILLSATRLHPSESKFATEGRDYLGIPPPPQLQTSNQTIPLVFARSRLERIEDTGASLLLWGLTQGVVSDFLDMLPPFDTLKMWVYPTFSLPDVRFACWVMSYNYRKRYQRMIDSSSEDIAGKMPSSGPESHMLTLADGTKRYYGRMRVDVKGRRSFARAESMREYFNILQKGFIVAMLGRTTIISFLMFFLWKAYKARRLNL